MRPLNHESDYSANNATSENHENDYPKNNVITESWEWLLSKQCSHCACLDICILQVGWNMRKTGHQSKMESQKSQLEKLQILSNSSKGSS